MPDLGIVQENLAFLMQRELDAWLEKDPSKTLGGVHTTMALYHRCLGIARFLSSANKAQFQLCLRKAAQARLSYLKAAASAGAPDDPFRTVPKNRAFYDAIVAADAVSAIDLAALFNHQWDPDREGEEDFLFARFMQLFFLELSGKAKDPAESALQRLADIVGGSDGTPECALCAALDKRDAKAFGEALEGILEKREDAFRNKARFPAIMLETERHIFVNGLAMVRLARQAGMTLVFQHPSLPPQLLDLQPQNTPLPPDAWKALD